MRGANKIFPSGSTCATCLCQDRKLYPVKDSTSFSVYCYSLNVSPKDVVCWECNHFVLKMAIFRNRALKARAYRTGKLIWDPKRVKSLSNLSISKGVSLDVTALDPLQVEIKTEPIFTEIIKAEFSNEYGDSHVAVNEEENMSGGSTVNANKEISGSTFVSTVSSAYFTVYPHIKNADSHKQTDIQMEVMNAPKSALQKTSAMAVGNASIKEAVKTQVSGEGMASATLMSLLTKKSTLKVPPLLEKVALDDPKQNESSVTTAAINTSHKEFSSDQSKGDISNSPPQDNIIASQNLLHTEVSLKNEETFIGTDEPEINRKQDRPTTDAICHNSDDDTKTTAKVPSVLNGFITLYPQRNDENSQHTDVNMDATAPMSNGNKQVLNSAMPKKPTVGESLATASLVTLLNSKNTMLKMPTASKKAIIKKQPKAKTTEMATNAGDALLMEAQATTDTLTSILNRPGISTADLVAQARRTCPWYVRALGRAEAAAAAAARAAARAAPAFAAAPYKCAHCLLLLACEEDMHEHEKAHDPMSGELSCDICTQRFKSESERNAHAAQHATRYCCCQCEYRTEHMDEMRRHNCEPDAAMWKYKRRRRRKPRRVRCKVCYSAFSDEDALGRHMGRMHPVPETAVCSICHKQFKNRNTLKVHYATVHKMKEKPSRPELFCEECGIQFQNPCSFRNHRLTLKHSSKEDWQFECDICKKKFPTKMFIRSHIRVFHNRELACECPECGASLLSPARLRAHRRQHAPAPGRAPRFVCHHCGKAVKTKRTLAEHLLRHEDLRPFACPLCPATFTYRAALYTHNRRKHLDIKGDWRKKPKVSKTRPQSEMEGS